MEQKIGNKIKGREESGEEEYQILLKKKEEVQKEVNAGPRASDKDFSIYAQKEKELEMIQKMIAEKKNF